MNPPLAPPQLAAGGLIGGRFQILARIASGGMGTVYRALDTATAQPVALKILNQGPGGAQAVSRLLREAEILAQLQAPGIVRYVADGFTEAGVFFLAMEWLDGHDLAHHLAQQRLDVASCLLLSRQIASALAVAHQAGIIHRDLKPSDVATGRRRAENRSVQRANDRARIPLVAWCTSLPFVARHRSASGRPRLSYERISVHRSSDADHSPILVAIDARSSKRIA